MVDIFIHAAKSDKSDDEILLTATCSRFSEYIKNAKKFPELIPLIFQKNPERLFGFYDMLQDIPNRFDVIVDIAKKIHKPENALI